MLFFNSCINTWGRIWGYRLCSIRKLNEVTGGKPLLLIFIIIRERLNEVLTDVSFCEIEWKLHQSH